MKILGLFTVALFAVAMVGCQSNDGDSPVEPRRDAPVVSDVVADENDDVEHDDMGAELLTKAQLEARGLTWIDFTEESCHDKILSLDEALEVPASGGSLTVELNSAANILSMIYGVSKDAIAAQYTGSYAELDYKVIESETAVVNWPVVNGPWCKDYYVLVVQPFPVEDFNGLSASFTEPRSLSISVAANPDADEHWYRIELARNMYHPEQISGAHWYYGSYCVLFVHQAAGKSGGVNDAKL